MIWALAFAVWVVLAAGAYLAMSRDVMRCVVGLALIGSAVNLVLLAAGRVSTAQPAVVVAGQTALGKAANSLPQALVLTAIVIGFALVCFAFVLVLQLVRRAGTDDSLELRRAEPPPTDPVKPPLEPVPAEQSQPSPHDRPVLPGNPRG